MFCGQPTDVAMDSKEYDDHSAIIDVVDSIDYFTVKGQAYSRLYKGGVAEHLDRPGHYEYFYHLANGCAPFIEIPESCNYQDVGWAPHIVLQSAPLVFVLRDGRIAQFQSERALYDDHVRPLFNCFDLVARTHLDKLLTGSDSTLIMTSTIFNRSLGQFNSSYVCHDPTFKDKANQRLVELVKRHIQEPARARAFVLDGAQAKTTTKLIDAGVQRKNIVIAEREENTWRCLKNQKYNIKRGTASDVLKDLIETDKSASPNIVYLDFCGGKKQTFEALCLLLKHRQQPVIVFACTYSKRDRHPPPVASAWNDHVNEEIVKIASKHKYDATPVDESLTSRHMATQFFVMKRRVCKNKDHSKTTRNAKRQKTY